MQTNQTNASLKTETSASMRVFGNNDLTGVIMSFYASNWGLRPPSLVSRGFKALVRARVRSSLYMCNCNGLWRVCLATGGVEYLAETPFGNPDDQDDYLSGQRSTTVDGAVVGGRYWGYGRPGAGLALRSDRLRLARAAIDARWPIGA